MMGNVLLFRCVSVSLVLTALATQSQAFKGLPSSHIAATDPRLQVLPTPQSVELLQDTVVLGAESTIEIIIGNQPSEKVEIAAEMLKKSLKEISPSPNSNLMIVKQRRGVTAIYLWDRLTQGLPPVSLSDSDREFLDSSKGFGQGYFLQTKGENEIWVVGSTDQGVLYGSATLLQLFEPRLRGGVQVRGTEVRDFPDFRYRAASDWLLRAELNRWAYDWGDGRRSYMERIQRKLDFCTRFKINMVYFDGFGWTMEKRPGYASMMRDLNGYARARGIKLMFGGYGANFEPRGIEPTFNIGKVHLNRRRYPDGEIYACFGESQTPDHPTFGTCRSNEALNAEVASEIEQFVRAVEPGALYIHHEDTGHFETTQQRWSDRCDQCKKKWPNPDFAAIDGGAAAMAYRYSRILRAAQSVKNQDTRYDAARDCTVVFISPPYGVDSGRSGLGNYSADLEMNWNKTLEFWSNALSLMPPSENLEIGFRETFPHPVTGQRWIDAYRQKVSTRNLNDRVFLFFLGGADQYSSGVFNFPYTANASMNGLFKGAEAIYNFNGGLHQEPQQLLNAEYSWNSSAKGSHLPNTFKESLDSWNHFMKNQALPEQIFGAGQLFENACKKIYGANAGTAMARFFHYNEPRQLPNGEGVLPRFYPEKIYPLVVLWRYLQGDSSYWNFEPGESELQVLRNLNIDSVELHRRLARVWEQNSKVTRKAREFVAEAIKASDLRQDAKNDVEYLHRCTVVGERFARLLSLYHQLIAERRSGVARDLGNQFKSVLSERQQLITYLHANFSFDPVDPMGGDPSSWLDALEAIRRQLLNLKGEEMSR